MNNVVYLVMSLVALLISAIFHEQWHARVALWLGDPTGKMENRLSWNPKYHIDPFQTFLLPVLLWLTMGTVFGGAKPVRVNPLLFRSPMAGNALVAVAGPLSNLFLAVVSILVMLLVWAIDPGFLYSETEDQVTYNALFLFAFLWTNVLLAAFNILPLPGLDGSRVLYLFLPRGGRAVLDAIEPFALIVTFMLLRAGVGNVLRPVFDVLESLLEGLFNPGFLSALGRALR